MSDEKSVEAHAHALVDELIAVDSPELVVEMLTLALHGVPDSVMDKVEAALRAPSPAPGPQTPPEESLCGEEEDLVTGAVPDPQEITEGLARWAAYCRRVGRNRVRAYDEAFALVQKQVDAWTRRFPASWDEVAQGRGLAPLNARERALVQMYARGLLGLLRELRAAGKRVVSR